MPDHDLIGHVPHAAPTTEARLSALEAGQSRLEAELKAQNGVLADIHSAIVGPRDGSRAGQAEQIRGIDGRLKKLEDANEADDKQRLNWRSALGISTIGAVIGQAFSWAKDHIK